MDLHIGSRLSTVAVAGAHDVEGTEGGGGGEEDPVEEDVLTMYRYILASAASSLGACCTLDNTKTGMTYHSKAPNTMAATIELHTCP